MCLHNGSVTTPLLFQPLTFGSMRLHTRSWVPAMVPWRSNETGEATPEVLAWYERFAQGQPGALVVEATGVRDVKSGPLLRISADHYVPGLRRLTDTVRAASQGRTRLFVQLIDFLAIRRRPEKAVWVRRFWQLKSQHRERLCAITGSSQWLDMTETELREAALALPHTDLLRVLDEREVEELEMGWRERVTDTQQAHIQALPQTLPALFAAAARRARAAGFDGVELHCAHAYTLASFLSRRNERTDGYGGTRAARARLPLEVLAAVRAAVGSDFVVGVRLLGDEAIAGGSTIDDAQDYALWFAQAGVEFVSVSRGGKFEDARQPKVGEAAYPYTGPSGHACMPTIKSHGDPRGVNLPLARAIRAHVRAGGWTTPIVGAGGIDHMALAERALQSGDCDLVAAARQTLADPDWWLKAELGREHEVRRCSYTNYCEGLDQRHKQVTCRLWDRDLITLDGDGGLSRSLDGKRRLLAPPWQP